MLRLDSSDTWRIGETPSETIANGRTDIDGACRVAWTDLRAHSTPMRCMQSCIRPCSVFLLADNFAVRHRHRYRMASMNPIILMIMMMVQGRHHA